jgi:hypothetical protein
VLFRSVFGFDLASAEDYPESGSYTNGWSSPDDHFFNGSGHILVIDALIVSFRLGKPSLVQKKKFIILPFQSSQVHARN